MTALPSFWDTFLLAIGLALMLEGVFYALMANRLPEILQMLVEIPPAKIRTLGLWAASAGLLWMLWVRYTRF
ncbi:MAG: DUF2065 domain-containing protein [Candidatus Dadabacteria bacterium]|nr:MAG: DUF2065 domain-containing protein [Candidatus Dadabacteria bacterium]